MKQIKLTLVLTLLMSMVGLQAFAAWDTSTKIEVDGLYYYLDNVNNQAQVTSKPSGRYTGNITIPSSFTYNTTNYSVTDIGFEAFYSCSGLTSVTIPNSVTSIGLAAFAYCSGLTSVTVPNSVTSISNNAFIFCTGLTSISVDTGNTKYDSRGDCNAIIETANNTLICGCKNTVIPNSVTSIGTNAFCGCSGLESVTIPNSVTSIGWSAFADCSGLESITIPNNVTSIGDYAFDGCSGLSSITIPSSVTSIGYAAFLNCSGLTTVTIPNSVTSIGDWAFSDCDVLTSVAVDINSPLTITDGTFSNRANATLCVPAGSKSAYKAANNWKEFGTIVDHIVFADANVKAICVAHWDTDGDGELSISEAAAVTTISSYFHNNTSITSFDEFVYFTGVTSIGEGAFGACSGLTSITIPNSVTSIGREAFYYCSGLTSIAIPNSVTSFGGYAFACSGLTSITIPNSITTINYNAFENCTALTSVSIPNSVTSIGNNAFSSCINLTSISIPNSVTSIGNYAFSNCWGLTSVTIGRNVTTIGSGPFSSCTNLSSIVVSSENTSYDSRNNCNAIIETATNKLVQGCTSSTIPDGVTSIGNSAFSGLSSLTSITIPNSVETIGNYAFADAGLTSLTVYREVPVTIDYYVFQNVHNCTLYVPAGSVDAYKAANIWKGFNIVEIIPESVTIAMKTGSGAARSMIAYSSKYALDFTDRPELKAYIACGYNSNREVMLVHVKVVPPYTGMVIKTTNGIYDGGEYDVPTTTEDYYYANLLVPVVETGTVTPTETIDDVEYTNFTIGTLDGGGIGFVKLTTNWTTHNKSYLRVPTSLYENTSYARAIRGFNVEFVEGEKATAILNAKHEIQEDEGDYYDLLGRKVKPNRQGLYIHKGKKVFIK